MASTLLLDRTLWDLFVDSNGNIAVATEPYSLAQDVASAIRLFLGEYWYDVTAGVPYWGQILGKWPPIALIKASIVTAALTVPGVVSAVCYLSGISGRALTGQVQITDTSGNVSTVGLPGNPFVLDVSRLHDSDLL